jgi:flagellar hook-associated protein 1 FlgK
VQVRSLDDQQTAQAAILQNLAAQEQSVVGVSIDEEVVQLLEYQRMVEAASRFISVVNTALQSIIEITG